MKRSKMYITIVLILVFLTTGCSEKTDTGTVINSKSDITNKKGTLICTRDATAQNNAFVDLEYEVSYNNGYVTVLHSTEKLISSEKETLDVYEEAYRNIFKKFEDLKYYDNIITRTDTSVTSETIIRYDKINTEELKKLENTDDTVIKDGKVSLKDWLIFAEKFGTKCSEK